MLTPPPARGERGHARVSLPLINIHRHGDIEQTCRSISLREAICIANREADRQWSCEECEHCGHESDGGEPEYAVRWIVCHKFPRYHHLKGFPFKKAPARCFQLDYFASAYAAADDWEDESRTNEVLAVWRQTDRYGRYVPSSSPSPAPTAHPSAHVRTPPPLGANITAGDSSTDLLPNGEAR
ncbi:MAG TPA: hypothetical protein VEA69_06025 [Tepidisphaeraceae bacterium]|nr:hypothetical protein [Tepidisphaeraceae bacterium]